jgi:hypothetical protein
MKKFFVIIVKISFLTFILKKRKLVFSAGLKLTGITVRETSYFKRFPKKLLLKSQKRTGSGSGSEMEL